MSVNCDQKDFCSILLMSDSNIFGDREIRLNNKIGKSFFNFT
jgi:hypothetical protein